MRIGAQMLGDVPQQTTDDRRAGIDCESRVSAIRSRSARVHDLGTPEPGHAQLPLEIKRSTPFPSPSPTA